VRTARELIDRHIRLFGMDAPTEIVVHSPTTMELEAWVAQVLSYAANDVQELDVIEAEVIEDGRAIEPAAG
jgi:hypothetical protein